MSAGPIVPFESLGSADLIVDGVYAGGTFGSTADDALARLLPVGNQGGFRYSGSPASGTVRLVALYTSGTEVDWPDVLDTHTGVFTYFGDNRQPGLEIHQTRRRGNVVLRDVFAWSHGTAVDRRKVPPFLLFHKALPGRSVAFNGLLVPGAESLTSDDDLVAIWRSTGGQRFQNYRARFTVLDVGHISRAWISDVLAGKAYESEHCPTAWRAWVNGRVYLPLEAPATTTVRPKARQLPEDPAGRAILAEIRDRFRDREHDFEPVAVDLWRLMAPATGRCDVTRPSRDGGRDAVGEYVLGPPSDPITIDFALEAKCYSPETSVGVRDVARLISRIRHREFGVFVTTSYFAAQAYSEVRADGHPIALICGQDIVDALKAHGYTDAASVRQWLDARATSVKP
ncbi:restriction endonuclease [Kribbella sp. ALI-6-A]|uniref:restriction endonuclease n=1 Tax=Kribbella sp. ALI-6-A TaxID=1933817 RepID=UPI00097C7847|nr:restriction endonuclease [Kribbella sp. ALI-6-A]ONI74445.1 restriction endonuclease [Kribbella sp. ALI-6-A]